MERQDSYLAGGSVIKRNVLRFAGFFDVVERQPKVLVSLHA
jgi:hypothetical protein